jgi:hypothetical protein
VENARLYTLPDVLPPLLVAVGGTRGAAQAGRLGDGMIGTDPDRSLLAAFDDAGGAGKPRYAELTVCWAKDEATGRRIAREQWPTMFQTISPRAQEIERQIQRVWAAYRVNPEAHENAPALLARLDEITLEMTQHPYPFEEWQVIYRQALQLGRALTGHRQILEQTLPEESTMTPQTTHSALDHEARSLSTRELVSRVLKTGSTLVAKEVELARAEIKADLHAELGVLKLLIAAALLALLGLNLLFVSAVFALTHWLPGWLAALGLAGMLLAIGFGLGLIGWARRVSAPLAITRKTVKEDMQWAKERLA